MFNFYGSQQPYGGYMPSYGQQQMQPVTSQQMSFVNGIEGAKGFIVPPNTSVFLMDSDSEQFFIKTADRNGMCNIKVYEFKEKDLTPSSAAPTIDTGNFVTRDEFNNLAASVQALITPSAAAEPLKKSLI